MNGKGVLRNARSFCVVFVVFTYQKALAPGAPPQTPMGELPALPHTPLLGGRGAPLPHPPRDFLHIFNFHNGRTGSFIDATALYTLTSCTLHTLTCAHFTLSPLHTHTRTHKHMHTRTHTRAHTHTHTLAPCKNRAFNETSLLSWSGIRSLMPLYLWKWEGGRVWRWSVWEWHTYARWSTLRLRSTPSAGDWPDGRSCDLIITSTQMWFRHRIYKGRGGGRVGGAVCGTDSCKLHP